MAILDLLRERHGLNLPDNQLQKIVETCAEIIIVQDQEQYEAEMRAAIDEGGGCSACGDLDGYSCTCEDEEDDPLGYQCMSCGSISSSAFSGGEIYSCGKCGGPTTEIY